MNEQSQKKGRSVLLIVSLVLNLFLVGLIVGTVGLGRHMHGGFDGARGARPPKAFVSPRHLMHAAPAESKRQMFKILRENWDDIRPELENIHAEREKVFELMKQEKFDGEALQVAVARLAEAEKQAHITSSATIIEMLKLLPVDDRREVIDELVRHERGRRGRRDHRRFDKFDRPFERNMEDDRELPEETEPTEE